MADNETDLILLVEDSEADVRVTKRAFKKLGVDNPVHHCEDGRRAINYLAMSRRPSGNRWPSLVLLDLNLPGVDGREVLRTIKDDDRYKSIPVVIFSTSDDERDVQDCYALGANSFVKKPHDLNGFVDAIQSLSEFWLHSAELPSRP
ncbi:response regulator [Kordiimonas lacus]|uniref:Response regulator receiver domain-containing protein n=1 Tax=Kordiimonas lacus TaxID=637679 RepID=A0A1G6YDW2_9PROT|nr:response regulator [Kordiimonas lacus]SDD87775.1 Response regulator receiver domain-containing protein [Kordiimonas lacus]